MVQKLLALVLIAAWQLQAAVPPHWHAGMSASEMVAHAQRRHFHWSCEPQPLPAFAEDYGIGPFERASHDHVALGCHHDDDAVYLDASAVARLSDDVAPLTPHAAPACFESSPAGAHRSLGQHASAPPRYGGALPALLYSTRLLL